MICGPGMGIEKHKNLSSWTTAFGLPTFMDTESAEQIYVNDFNIIFYEHTSSRSLVLHAKMRRQSFLQVFCVVRA
jgi:hypothetical protein